jgi:hypothetical protein
MDDVGFERGVVSVHRAVTAVSSLTQGDGAQYLLGRLIALLGHLLADI